MTLMSMALREMKEREAYLSEVYTPFYVMSYALHCFNLENRLRQFYWEGRRLPSLRLHLTNMAPSGFMKTYYGENLGWGEFAVFQNTKVRIDRRQEMSGAGLVGTKTFADGVVITTEGVAEKFKEDILVVDEWSGVINANKIGYNAGLESQMLALLDSGDIFKTLGSGEIEYNSQLTLWCGIQPGKMDLMGGMARRTVFTLFMPTIGDSRKLIAAQFKAQNIQPDREKMGAMWARVDKWRDDLKCVNSVRFDESVLDLYDKLDVYCFEVTIFNRLALAYHLATKEVQSDIIVNVDDKEFQTLALKAKEWRDAVVQGVPAIQLSKMIKAGGEYNEQEGTYTIKRNELVKDALMLTWNASQVNDLLIDMQKNSLVRIKGNMIELVSEE